MKAFFNIKIFTPLAVALVVATSPVSQAQDQPAPQSVEASALPANVVPGSPLAEVVKMIQAGVDGTTIQGYVNNSQSPFNLDADQIIFLKDEGAPSELINAMIERDKVLYASNLTQQPPPGQPAPVTSVASGAPYTDAAPPDMAPPTEEVGPTYFNNTLTPYGSWVNVDGYGRCWRPTAVNYDTGWRPYCDRGHWVYTDCGWYWDSDYAWGTTFHYGRWFQHARYGWCWYPDTVWAPSWVTWRSATDYCGWAPLPPFAIFRPGIGFSYRGRNVGFDFDFGLGSDCFVFVPPARFCDRHPRTFCVDSRRVPQVFHQTTVINNFNVNSKTIVNRGIAVDRIASVTHRQIEPVHVSTLPNAGRQGWRGEGYQNTMHRTTTAGNNNNNHPTGNNSSRNFSTTTGNTSNPSNGNGNGQVNRGTGQFNNANRGNPVVHSDGNNHDNNNGSQSGAVQTDTHRTPPPGRPPVSGSQSTATYNNGQSPSLASQQQQQQQERLQQQRQLQIQQQQQLQQQRQQMESRSYNANNGVPQNPNGLQPGRSYSHAVPSDVQQHGAQQLQQPRQYGAPVSPNPGAQTGGRNNGQTGQAVQQSQGQPHSSGNPSGGGGNNGGQRGNGHNQ